MIRYLFVIMLWLVAGNSQAMAQQPTPQGVIFNTTGSAGLDQKIREEASMINSSFGVHPEIYALVEAEGPNALAFCDYKRVYIGFELLRQELWTMEYGPLAVAGIMAHEFAHIYQCDRTKYSMRTKQRELQADYLAGWYMRSKAAAGRDVSGFIRSFYAKGDAWEESSDPHGTREERAAAAIAGLNDSSSSVSRAFENSYVFLDGDSTDEEESESQQCTREVRCTHETACVHKVRRTEQVSCQHRASCSHAVPCQHCGPCGHMVMGPYGPQPMHNYDCAHQGDLRHSYDQAHEYDVREWYETQHDHDYRHSSDTETYTCQ